MNPELYTRAQRALAELKGVVFELITDSAKGISNAEIGRQLGIYGGHSGQAGHISRTILELLEKDEIVHQDAKTKLWSLRPLKNSHTQNE